jgi:lipopolysaccharide transport system permease protein|tara:strand:+ start:222 stop:998 length:777 start_codon:yes stop_codon:yes gene_type:complete
MNSIVQEMWKTKGILFNFAITDLKIRYKNSVLGVLWSILEPLLMLAVLFFVFSTMFKNEIDYFPIYLLSGLITFNFFKNGTTIALSSLSDRSSLITQIYFPRSIPAISSVFTASIMLIVELTVLGVFMVYFQFTPSLTILYLIPIYMLAFILVLGVSLALSVLNVKFRDIQFIWGIILHAGFFLTPIFYRFDFLPESVQNILQLSPVVQIVEMVHHVALYGTLPSLNSILYSVGSIFAILGIGYLIFRKYQSRIVEEL